MQQILESLCFLQGQGTSVCTSSKKQCSRHYTSQVPDPPRWGPHTINTRERAPSPSDWQAPGLAAASPGHRVRKQRPQQIPCREKGKAPPVGGQCAGPVHISQVPPLHRAGLTPGGYPTETLAQFPKDVFSRPPIRALMK